METWRTDVISIPINVPTNYKYVRQISNQKRHDLQFYVYANMDGYFIIRAYHSSPNFHDQLQSCVTTEIQSNELIVDHTSQHQ